MHIRSGILATLFIALSSPPAWSQGIHPLARPEFNRGPVDASRRLNLITVHLGTTPQQQAELDKILEEQRDPSSPNYHRWLTPEQFAARFGAAAQDLDRVSWWLESEGLKVNYRARAGNWLSFSGSAGDVGRALKTEFHRYVVRGEEHFANASAPAPPDDIKALVSGFTGLDDFNPRPQLTNGDGTHSLAPGDIATIYNLTPLYAQGIDGTGQTIVVVGRVDLEPNLTGIRAFRAKFNLPAKDPQVVVFGSSPGAGKGLDLFESDLDIEWANAVAPNANVVYVNSASVQASAFYAIDQNLGTVINYSYAICEAQQMFLGTLFRAIVQQGNAQGITFIAGSGDAGPAGCDQDFVEPQAANGLAAAFPASIPEVTAVGGTAFNEGTGTFWSSTNAANGGSALSYIPERAWNSPGAVAGSGGGPSVLYAKPAWQSGPGVPADGARDVPDLALAAFPGHDGYYACTPDCDGGGGGTSYAAPVFAGMVALLNHALVSRGIQKNPGLGNLNPTLYRLARTGNIGLHDITVGDTIVPCVLGTPNCTTGKYGYAAGPGYDLATGLGSVDLTAMVNAWSANSVQTTLTATPDLTKLTLSDTMHLTITVTPSSGGKVPTGNVFVSQSNVALDGLGTLLPGGNAPVGSATLAAGTGSSATATITIYPGTLALGQGNVTVAYAGDASFNGSSATVAVNVSMPTGHSAIVPKVYANDHIFRYPPVGIGNPDNIASGFPYCFSIDLVEAAGVATKMDTFTAAGFNASSTFAGNYFPTANIPANGTLSGGICLNFAASTIFPNIATFVFGGVDAGGFRWSTQVVVPIVATQELFSLVSRGGLVNGASFKDGIAPGMVLSVFGTSLTYPDGATFSQATSLPLPLSLGNSSAKINGVPAPYYFSSPSQLNIQVPYETAPGLAVLTITNGLKETYNYSFNVQAAAPGIFAYLGDAVPFASGNRGGTYILFITGEGQVTPALATGATPDPSTPIANLPKPKLTVSMTIGDVDAPIVFAGIPSGLAGVTQINFTVPQTAPIGKQPLVVTVGGVKSPPVNFTVN